MPHALALFVAASVGLALTPGPDILTVVTRSITQGTRIGLVAAMGFASGLSVHTAAAALGLSVLLKESPSALLGVRIAGVAYLLYLAFRMVTSHDEIVQADASGEQRRGHGAIYWQSVLMNILNPKVALFFLAFLPQFVDPSGSLPHQFILLGLIFALCTLACFGTVALLAGNLSRWIRRRPSAARPLRLATALVFVLIALRLVLN